MRLVISVDDRLLPQNVMLPLVEILYNVLHLIIIGWLLIDCTLEYLAMIGHQMSMLSEDCTDNIV